MKESHKNTHNAKNSHFGGVVFGIPTFGMVSANFMLSMGTKNMPIFTNAGYHVVQGKPVDVARNEIADAAIKGFISYVLFRDDDTLAPQDAIPKLIGRIPMKERAVPYENGRTIVGGIVYSKAEPPVPMVHRQGYTAGYHDWEIGDLIECDAIGMGCTLVPTGVLRKCLENVKYWHCIHMDCDKNWSGIPYIIDTIIAETQGIQLTYDKEGDCPHCKNPLVPVWFRTLRIGDDKTGVEGAASMMTEDAYFCRLAIKSGCKVYADTAVLCDHEVFNPDPRQTKHYCFHPGVGPAWKMNGGVYFYPQTDTEHALMNENKPAPKLNGKVKFNIGAGGVNRKDYINIDLNTKADFRCDARNLTPAVKKYGQADEICAKHLLEHIRTTEVLGTVRHWLRCLKPGGVLRIETPDAVWAAENFANYAKNGKERNDFPEMVVMGRQWYDGDEHKSLIYEKRMHEIADACKEQIEKRKIWTIHPKMSNQRLLRATFVKKGVKRATAKRPR